MSTPTTTRTAAKTVFLIRHAESEENRRVAALSRTFKTLGKFSFPSSSDIYASTELLNLPAQVDSNVSEIGASQIKHMGEKLKQAKFLETTGIELVAHSPLLRARETSEGMLGCSAVSSEEVKEKAESVTRVVQTELLLEKTPAEWTPLYYNGFKKRIGDFEEWLWNQKEGKIALVGHSQFFKAMLGLDFKFGNCEVWKLTFDLSKVDGTTASGTNELTEKETSIYQRKLPPQWSDLELLYPCEIQSSPKTT
jgi:phosphohistidine phosphatase SixA